jgi:hypothetical protein
MRRIDLGRRPASRDELAAWYGAALDAQAASGLSGGGYAEQLGVSAWTLYQWRRRLSGSGDDVSEADQGKLVEVTMARQSRSSGGSLVVRVNEGRRSIEVPRGFDDDDLRRLVAALESC